MADQRESRERLLGKRKIPPYGGMQIEEVFNKGKDIPDMNMWPCCAPFATKKPVRPTAAPVHIGEYETFE